MFLLIWWSPVKSGIHRVFCIETREHFKSNCSRVWPVTALSTGQSLGMFTPCLLTKQRLRGTISAPAQPLVSAAVGSSLKQLTVSEQPLVRAFSQSWQSGGHQAESEVRGRSRPFPKALWLIQPWGQKMTWEAQGTGCAGIQGHTLDRTRP